MKIVLCLALVLVVVLNVDANCGCKNGGLLKRIDGNRLGDMLLDKTDILLINGFKAHDSNTKRWNKVVKYQFKGSFPRDLVSKVTGCLNEMQRDLGGCLKFEQSQSGHFIEIGSDQAGCWSALGKTGGRSQQLNLQVPGCTSSKGTIKHEFIHALGFMHTHMRSDRDQHITVFWDNIQTAMCSQFTKCGDCVKDGDYETNSVMHYPSYGFACQSGQDAFVKKNGEKIGYNHETTRNDINMIKQFYKC